LTSAIGLRHKQTKKITVHTTNGTPTLNISPGFYVVVILWAARRPVISGCDVTRRRGTELEPQSKEWLEQSGSKLVL
jgi:hypothetical protein